jgi:lipoprotein NlpI
MSLARRSPLSVPIGAVLTLAAAGFFYLGMMASLGDVQNPNTDAMGRGFAAAFAVVFGLLEWITLAILLLIGGVKGEMPNWSAIAAALLLPLSGIAALMAFEALDTGGSALYRLVPGALPPVIAAYAFWARLPGLHATLPALPTSLVAWSAVAILTLAPWPQFIAKQAADTARISQEKKDAEAKAVQETERQRRNFARFQEITAASPLWDWAPFFAKDNPLQEQAIRGARALTHRQADAEEALRSGMGFPLIEYRQLDLAATPAFCTAASDFLYQAAATHHPPSGDADYLTVQQYFEPYDEAVEWLTRENCDLDGAVAQILNTVSDYKQSGSRDAYLGALAWRRGNGLFARGDNDRALAEYDTAIKIEPDNAQFLKSRGDVYFAEAQYDQAIADYDEAIRLNPGYTEAYFSRGNAYEQTGDDAKALDNLGEAIRRDPGFAVAYNNRGDVYVEKGDLDHAIDDYAEAVRLAPKSALAVANRGRARFYQGAYPLAVDDLAAAAALKPGDAYIALWLYLARLRAGQNAHDTLADGAANLDRSAWPYPIVAALIGNGDAKSVVSEAARPTNPERKGQECEANFYFGAKAAAEGASLAARNLLEPARANCPASYFERSGARYELARLPARP